MRNELVVSFLLYIGLTSGNIVPTSITKLTVEQNVKKLKDAIKDKPHKTHLKTTLRLDLEDHRNTIKDSEILSQGVESPNNISGRSFIFIRQKFKSPILNLFHSQMLNPNSIAHATSKSVMVNVMNDKFEELSRRFSTLNVANSNYANPNVANTNVVNPNLANPYIANPNAANPNVANPKVANLNVVNQNGANSNVSNPIKNKPPVEKMSKSFTKPQGTLLSQLCYSRLKLENDGMVKKIKDKLKVQEIERVASDHREYLELLKPPLLRKNYGEGDKNSMLQENERQMLEASRAPFFGRIQDSFAKLSLDMKNSLKKVNNDRRTYITKELYNKNTYKTDQSDPAFNNIEENMLQKSYDEDSDDYKGMDKYSKNTYDVKPKDKKKPAQVNRIHFCHDCGKNGNHDPYQWKRPEADCKCGRHVYIKGRSDWQDHEKLKDFSNQPTDRQIITIRLNGMDNKDDAAVIDVPLMRNHK